MINFIILYVAFFAAVVAGGATSNFFWKKAAPISYKGCAIQAVVCMAAYYLSLFLEGK